MGTLEVSETFAVIAVIAGVGVLAVVIARVSRTLIVALVPITKLVFSTRFPATFTSKFDRRKQIFISCHLKNGCLSPYHMKNGFDPHPKIIKILWLPMKIDLSFMI